MCFGPFWPISFRFGGIWSDLTSGRTEASDVFGRNWYFSIKFLLTSLILVIHGRFLGHLHIPYWNHFLGYLLNFLKIILRNYVILGTRDTIIDYRSSRPAILNPKSAYNLLSLCWCLACYSDHNSVNFSWKHNFIFWNIKIISQDQEIKSEITSEVALRIIVIWDDDWIQYGGSRVLLIYLYCERHYGL